MANNNSDSNIYRNREMESRKRNKTNEKTLKKKNEEKRKEREQKSKKVKKLTEIGQTILLQKNKYYNIITIIEIREKVIKIQKDSWVNSCLKKHKICEGER